VPFNRLPESLMPERRALELQEKQIARETKPNNTINTTYTMT